MTLTYTMTRAASRLEVFLNGDFTFTENMTFRSLVEEVVETGATSVTVDLSKLRTVDSAGLSMLILLRNRLASRQGSVALLNPPPQVERILEVVEFDRLFEIRR
jgi:anti-sigma B factor antagonist